MWDVIAVDGVSTDPSSDPDSTGEVMLDIDVAGGLGGGAKIAVYFSTFDEKGAGGLPQQGDQRFDQRSFGRVDQLGMGRKPDLQQRGRHLVGCGKSRIAMQASSRAAHLGITVCVSTGDDGSEAQMRGWPRARQFPGDKPLCSGCRRHDVACAQGAQRAFRMSPRPCGTTDREAEQEAASATLRLARPGRPAKWSRLSIRVISRGRAIPDVAANADPSTGYLTMSGGKLQVVGGTSCVRSALGEPRRADQRFDRRARRQFQRAALLDLRTARRAAGHHVWRQRYGRPSGWPIQSRARLGRVHRMGRAGRPEAARRSEGQRLKQNRVSRTADEGRKGSGSAPFRFFSRRPHTCHT